MTFPQSKPASRLWWANDPTERDSIGSNDGLDVGDVVFQLDDNTWYRCTAVTGGDTSTWVAGGAAAATWAATLSVGNTSGATGKPTISDGDDLNWSDGTFDRLSIVRNNDDIEMQLRDGAGALQGTIDLDTATAEVRLPADVVMDSANPVLFIGNTAGTPTIQIRKVATGTGIVDFLVGGTFTTGDWSLRHGDDEVMRLFRHDGTALREAMAWLSPQDIRFPGVPTGTVQLVVGGGDGAPTLKLDADTLSEASVLFQSEGTTQFGWHLTADDDLILRDAASGTVATFPTGGGAEALFSGRVGINGADPDDASVNSDDGVFGTTVGAHNGVTIMSSTTGRITFGDAGSNIDGAVVYSHTLRDLQFVVAGGTHWSVSNDAFFPAGDLDRDLGRVAGNRVGEVFAGSYNAATRAVDDTDSPVTWAATNGFLELDATSGVITANMPAISDGKILYANIVSAASDITFDGDGAETINGSTTKVVPGTSPVALYKFIARTATDWLMVAVGAPV